MRFLICIPFLLLSSTIYAQKTSYHHHLNISKTLSVQKAISYMDSVIFASKNNLPPDTLALFYHKIGIKYFLLRDYHKAILSTNKGKVIREQIMHTGEDLTEDLSNSYNNLSGFHGQLFKITHNFIYSDSCIFYAKKVISLGHTSNNPSYANAHKELATQYENMGEYDKSLDYYNRGIDFLMSKKKLSIRQKKILAFLYLNKSLMFSSHSIDNNYTNSLRNIRHAAATFDSLKMPFDLALCYEQIGNIYTQLNQPTQTIIWFNKSISLYKTLINENYLNAKEETKKELGKCWNNFGNFYLEQKNYEEAEKCFQASLKIKEARLGKENHPDKASYYVNIGEVHHEQKNYEKAAALYHQSIENYTLDFKTKDLSAQPDEVRLKKCPDKTNLLYTLGKKAEVLADMYDATGDSKNAFNAIQTLRTADHLIDIMRADHSETQSKLFWREKTRDIYEQALSLAFKSNKPKEAFYFFEKSKSILLLDAMSASNARQLIPDSLAAEEMRLLRARDTAREATTTDISQQPNYLIKSDSLTDFQKILATQYPRYYQMRYEVNVPDLDVNDKTQHIHFFYGENHIYTMRFGAGESDLKRIPRNAQTDDLIKKYLHQFSNSNIITKDLSAYNDLAFKVYDLLIKPLFPDGNLPEELVLLPDDFLNVLPFDALKSQADGDYLLQQTNIRYAYSINVLKNQQSTDNQKIKTLGMAPFADSSDSLALSYSAEELAMAEKYGQGLFSTGNDATKDLFLKNAPNFQFLHLSTHAREKGQNGNPEIFFANNERLDLSKLYSTEFNSNLIILSACETGLGKIKKGEGVLSLNRGFTYAGAKSIISSLWRVNDKSTSDILSNFYANLDNETTKSNALHSAKKDFVQNADVLFQSPYYWAGLTYSGSDSTVVLERDNSWMFLLLGGLGLLGFLFWFFFKRREEEEVLPSPIPFLKQLFVEMEEAKADFSDLTIDHICYRVETKERYLELKEKLSKHGKILTEKPIGGRPIATFRLNKPYVFQEQKIYLLELPAPKEGRFYAEGWEHIEMVIKPDFQDFMSEYPHLDFDTKAINKKVNPEVRLTFPTGAVKFHHYPLDYVIEHLD